MANQINMLTSGIGGIEFVGDSSDTLEFLSADTKVAEFTSSGVTNSSLQNPSISINGSTVPLGATADLEQDCIHLRVSGSTNPVEVANLAVIPFAIHTNVGGMTHSNGTVTIDRDGIYLIHASLLANTGGTAGATGNFRLYKNGARIIDAYAYAKDYNTWEKSTLVGCLSLNADDTLALHSGGIGRFHTTVHSSWTIQRIGDG